MKPKMLSAVMAICMVLMLFPTMAEAEGTATTATVVNSSLPDAVDGMITLTGDVTLTEKFVIDSTSLTINGNGHKITTAATKAIEVVNGTDAPITVTLNDVTIVNTADYGRCLDTRNDNITLNLNNVTLTATGVNSQPLTLGGYDTGKVTVVVDNASEIDAGASGYGIITFVPNDLTINGSVDGYASLYMKEGSAGSKVVVNGVLNSTNIHNGESNNFGTIVLEENSIDIDVNENATLKATKSGDAIQTNLCLAKVSELASGDKKVEITIADGANVIGDVALGLDTNTTSVNTTNTAVTEALKAEGYNVVNGQVTAVAKIGDTEYMALADAVAAVPTDGTETTITLVGDSAGNGFKVRSGQNIVFDFAGYTYTINGVLVGSKGTETLCAQLLKGATVTFKNGTITSTKGWVIIQNYCNLTLEDFNVDGTKSDKCICAISNNNGSLTVKGDSDILSAEDDIAVDIYYWPNGGYDTVNVVFDKTYTGNVVGLITYGPDSEANASDEVVAEKLSLAINGNGNFDVKFFGYGNDMEKANIQISGGTFTASVPEEYLVQGFACGAVQDGDTVNYVVHIHTAGKTVRKNDATCVADGYTGDVVCSVCSTVMTRGTDIEATGVHTYLDGKCTMCGADDPDYKPDEKVEMGTTDAMEDTLNDEAANITGAIDENGKLSDDIKVDDETKAKIEEVVAENAADDSVIITIVVEQVATPVEESTVPETTTTAMESGLDAAKQEIEENSTEAVEDQGIVQYLDLSVLVKSHNETEGTKTTLGELQETKNEMEFTITIPDEYLKPGYELFVLRYHDGQVDKLPLRHVEGNIYAFSTNKFSSYALAYVSTHVHTETLINVEGTNCGTDGYTGDVVCSTCNTTLQEGSVIKADGNHHWSEWKNQEGIAYTFRECWDCGASEYLNADTTADAPKADAPATSTGAPATGDTSNMFVWITLMVVCCGVVLGTMIYRKNK